MVKRIDMTTGEEVDVSLEEVLELLKSGEGTLTGVQQVISNDDGSQVINQIYGIDPLNNDGMDRSINIFGETGDIYYPALIKARKRLEESGSEDNALQMDNSIVDYIVAVDDMSLPTMYIVTFTKECVRIASYVRDENRTIGEPMTEQEHSFVNDKIIASIDEVRENATLLTCFGVYEIIKILEEKNLLAELKAEENMGTGVMVSVIGEDDDLDKSFETKIVRGLERPELPCMLFGGLFSNDLDEAIMMRPYPDEVFNSFMENIDESYDRFEELKEKVEAGEDGALGELAREYMQAGHDSFDDEKDEYYILSIETAKKAVDAGDLYGYWLLALSYDHGRGVDIDKETAVKYYKLGAEKGEHNCQNSLACLYMRGEGVEENREEGFKLFEKSAAQGNKLAEFSLCKAYEYGHGTEVNIEKAIEWGEKAAVGADAEVKYEVAKLYMYENDEGKMIDIDKARYWLEEAADMGHEMAYGMLNFDQIWDMQDSPKEEAFIPDMKQILEPEDAKNKYEEEKRIQEEEERKRLEAIEKEEERRRKEAEEKLRKEAEKKAFEVNAKRIAEKRKEVRSVKQMIYGGNGGFFVIKPDGTVDGYGLELINRTMGWKDIKAIGVGRDHVVGLKENGTVIAAGDNEFNQCNVRDWKNIKQIAVGYNYTVGLKEDGTVVATGDSDASNYYSESNRGCCDVSDWKDVIEIDVGYKLTVGLRKDGTVLVAGDCCKPSVDYTSGKYDWRDIGNWPPVIDIAAQDCFVYGITEDGRLVTNMINLKDDMWTDIVAVSAPTNGCTSVIGVKADGSVIYQWDQERGDDITKICDNLKDAVYAVGDGNYRYKTSILVVNRDGSLTSIPKGQFNSITAGVKLFNDINNIAEEKKEAKRKPFIGQVNEINKKIDALNREIENTSGMFAKGKIKKAQGEIEKLELRKAELNKVIASLK